jgi:ribosomal-protein-serine acetyltransferase
LSELPPRLAALGLRALKADDAAELQTLVEANRGYLSRWLPWAPGQDLTDCEKFIANAEAQFGRNDGFQASIAPEGRIVGVVGFHSVDWTNRNTTMGYWLAEAAQGGGIMTAALRALVDHAFDEWNLHRIEIHCAPENHRSRAIPIRLGFREEATLREKELIGGRYLDSIVYGLLEGEWKKDPPPPAATTAAGQGDQPHR